MADFLTAYNITVVGNEGGYRNFNWDAETYRGINRNAHPGWSGWAVLDARKPIPFGKIYADLEPTVQTFYRDNYWNKIKGAYISSQQLANLIFDFTVQSGQAIFKIQEAINKVLPVAIAVDGIIGNQTITALNSNLAYKINNAIIDARIAYYEKLHDQGIISPNDFDGVMDRVKRFPYLKQTIIGGSILALMIGTYLVYLASQ